MTSPNLLYASFRKAASRALPAAALLAFAATVQAQTVPEVTIDSGPLIGAATGGVVSFKGIPYAAAPLGDLRWREPQPAEPWAEPRQATAFGPDCSQVDQETGQPAADSSEDCLFLNVWAPAEVADAPYPVLVWIHGGGFLVNGGAEPELDGSDFARNGVIVVTMNYRMGRFGFFAHPALTSAGEGMLGNYGLMDQAAALQWVQRNIAAFGGDPERVTLGGLSAGGISVSDLLVSPKATGLFDKAIILSGGGRYTEGGRTLHSAMPTATIEAAQPFPVGSISAETAGVTFALGQGIEGNGPDTLAALRALSEEQVLGDLAITKIGINGYHKGVDDHAGGPIIDGVFKTLTVEDAALTGQVADVPLIIGTTDADLPTPMPEHKDMLFTLFGEAADAARAVYDPDGTADDADIAYRVGRDWLQSEPARFFARQTGAEGAPSWLYVFGYRPDLHKRDWPKGVPHGREEAFFFHNAEVPYGEFSEADNAMQDTAHGYFVNFVKTGDPNGPGLAPWSPIRETPDGAMHFGDDGEASQVESWDKDALDMVSSVRPRNK